MLNYLAHFLQKCKSMASMAWMSGVFGDSYVAWYIQQQNISNVFLRQTLLTSSCYSTKQYSYYLRVNAMGGNVQIKCSKIGPLHKSVGQQKRLSKLKKALQIIYKAFLIIALKKIACNDMPPLRCGIQKTDQVLNEQMDFAL